MTCASPDLPPSKGMNNLFPLSHGMRWSFHHFCQLLHIKQPASLCYGILSAHHCKRVYKFYNDYNDWEHEALILDVVTLVPGTNTPQPNGHHTYIELFRCKEHSCRESSFPGISGSAYDTVIVLPQKDEAHLDPESTITYFNMLSWSTELPKLYDVLEITSILSLAYPKYNIFTHPCYWLARTVYFILKYGFTPVHEDVGVKPRSGFLNLLFCHSNPGRSARILVLLCKHNKQWKSDYYWIGA